MTRADTASTKLFIADIVQKISHIICQILFNLVNVLLRYWFYSPVHLVMTRADTASTRLFIASSGLFKVFYARSLLQQGWSLLHQDYSKSFSNKILHWTWSFDCCFIDHWLVFFARSLLQQGWKSLLQYYYRFGNELVIHLQIG